MDSQSQAEELISLLMQYTHQPALETAEQVTRGEGALLSYLANRHDGATAGELRGALDVGSGRIANALKHLEGKSMIVRTPSPEDGRVVLVHLTALGREFITARHLFLLRNISALLDELGTEDSEALIRIVRKLAALHPAAAPS